MLFLDCNDDNTAAAALYLQFFEAEGSCVDLITACSVDVSLFACCSHYNTVADMCPISNTYASFFITNSSINNIFEPATYAPVNFFRFARKFMIVHRQQISFST